MDPRTKKFLEWFGRYATGVKEIEVAKAVITPELFQLLDINDLSNTGSFHGTFIKIVPSYRVIPEQE